MANLTFYLWFSFNVILLIHIAHEAILLLHALAHRTKKKVLAADAHLPFVTVQLPLYNEKYVVERLLEAVARLDYPRELLEVQILDDSNDETSAIIQDFLANLSGPSFQFTHLRRHDRSGFKAGALGYGLKLAKGELIAIFDADFVPDPKFLLHTLAHFENPKVGMVQTRWLHINEHDSIITRAQAIMLNTHFTVEHMGRSHANGFINFNGTAGVWRKECIEAAGGWQADTLTEDLDLSFRAQMKGWKFKYLFDVGSPAELPATFDAWRTQQFRWSKGGAQCLVKNFSALWKSDVSASAKWLGTFHLLSSSIYLVVAGILLLSPAVYYLQKTNAIQVPFMDTLTAIGPLGIVSILLIFFTGDMMASRNKLRSALLYIPSVFVYLSMATGISLYMVFGIVEAYLGKSSPFVRTPKFGTTTGLTSRVKRGYSFKKEYSILALEILALSYGLFWMVTCFYSFNALTFSYGLIILLGFSLSIFFKNKTFRWKR